ncbi:MAG: FHA domain-containing protein [Planctomycetota bacterium]|jgi:hypothetical protein
MDPHLSLAEFKVKYGILTKQDFLAKFRAPFLVIEFGSVETLPGKDAKDAEAVPLRDRTHWNEDGAADLQAIVVPLVKSDRNEKGDRITLGRSDDNDVVVHHQSVSKFHAYFLEDPESGRLSLAEAGSSYGTTVEGDLVEKGQPRPLEDRASLVFAASVLATYFTPASFYDYMDLMAQPS